MRHSLHSLLIRDERRGDAHHAADQEPANSLSPTRSLLFNSHPQNSQRSTTELHDGAPRSSTNPSTGRVPPRAPAPHVAALPLPALRPRLLSIAYAAITPCRSCTRTTTLGRRPFLDSSSWIMCTHTRVPRVFSAQRSLDPCRHPEGPERVGADRWFANHSIVLFISAEQVY